MNLTSTYKHLFFSVFIGLAAGLVAGSPALFYLLPLLPALLSFVGAAWGSCCIIAALLPATALLFAANSLVDALYMLAAFLPATLILFFILKRKQPYRYAVVLITAVLALWGYAVLCLPSLLAGGGPFDGMAERYLSAFRELMAPLTELGLETQGSALQAAEMVTLFEEVLQEMAPELTIAGILLYAELVGFLNTVVACRLLKRAKADVRPMAPLVLWQLPKDFFWGALILGAGAFACGLLELENSAAVVSAVEYILLPPLALMGVSFFEFSRLVSPRKSEAWRIFTSVALFVLFPTSLYILAGLGILDGVMGARKRIVKRK